jgi:hypothetical protein
MPLALSSALSEGEMAKHTPPLDFTAAGYPKHEVTRFIHARIEGREWSPGPMPEHPEIERLKSAQERTGLSNFTLWSLEQQGRFPRRIKLTSLAPVPTNAAA